MILDNGLIVLKEILPFYNTVVNHTIGYKYDMMKNRLLLPPSEVSELKTDGISEQKADRLLRLECFSIKNQILNSITWFDELDSVSQFVIIGSAKLNSVSEILFQKQVLDYLQQGRFTLAAYELQKCNVNNRLITILKTGKVR
jgi:hypothetical protein